MRRLLGSLPLLVCLMLASGCAMCCASYDCDYPYSGGRWMRHNPSSGRVGSAFDEAGGPVEMASEAPREEPTPAEPTDALPAPETPSRIPRDLGETYLP